ncbi:Uu.00g129800.m01.CDS01 [Anthostomella pinea]|uniref:Uu.00g129800.m01.CDS01 n=1 Tax=Anthostomella pinea TaxID=933095 RepID=A0AAI8VJ63_9PEZI|nr:Uu.00g129800.m01.CDS01 [Anthostomella pinea]
MSATKLEYPEDSFPTLKPAFIVKAWGISDQFPCGDVWTGGTLLAVPFYDGIVESVGGFEPRFKFEIKHGCDYFKIDQDKAHGRLVVKVILSDDEGRAVTMTVYGICELNNVNMPILMGDPSAASAPFGYSMEHISFESGHDGYKPLESMLFAGSQRFTAGGHGSLGIEVRASRIISGTGTE